MLEELAFSYIGQSESQTRGLAYALYVAGGVCAGLTSRSELRMRRAPYFAYTCIAFLFISVCQLTWLNYQHAIAGGYMWLLMVTDVGSALVAGYFVAYIAMARSRDAYGHAGMAFLAFIPVANFWLLFTSPRDYTETDQSPVPRVLSGGFGVVTGMMIFVLSVLTIAFLETRMAEEAETAQGKTISQEILVQSMINAQGLKHTLKSIASEGTAVLPVKVDEVTTLVSIQADETELRRIYRIEFPFFEISDQLKDGIFTSVCGNAMLQRLLRAGATVREGFVDVNGEEIGSLSVTKSDCAR